MTSIMTGNASAQARQELALTQIKEELSNQERRLQHYWNTRNQSDRSDIIDLREFWGILLRRRQTIHLTLALTVCAAVCISLLMRPVYRASTVIQIELSSDEVIDYQNVTRDESAASSKDFYQTQYELLQSRALAQRVIRSLNLTPETLDARTSTQHDVLEYLPNVPLLSAWSETVLDIESMFIDHLSIEPVRNSRLVRIHFDNEDPTQAAHIVNAVAEEFIQMNLDRKINASSYAKTFLEDRIKQVRGDLEDSERAFQAYIRDRGIIDQEDKLSSLMRQLHALSDAQVASQAALIEAESSFRELSNSSADGIAQALGNELIYRLKERLSQLEATYQERLNIFQPNYPAMIRLSEEISQARAAIDKEIAAIREGVRIRYQTRQREHAQIAERVERTQTAIRELNERSTEFQAMKREVDTNRELYDGLLQRLKEVDVVSGIASNNISVVDKADVPLEKHSPILLLNIAGALALGLFCGLVIALLQETLDDTIKTNEDLESIVDKPVLGITPWLSNAGLSAAKVALMSHLEPSSPIAEAHRTMRTALMLSSSNGAPNVLHFTSAMPSEGKTTSAVNTAINFAQTGATVLLIDGDLRNPSMHKIFNCPNDTGLSTYLTGAIEPGKTTHATGIDNIFIMPSGPIPPNPAELLQGARMLDLAALAAERFDYVIIDGPPLMGLADAMLLADVSKATLLVVAANTARRGGVDAAMRRLQHSRANVLGTVLSKFNVAKSNYGYGYSYQYAYAYGERALGHEARS